jgi:hypothetical protein
MTHVKPVQLQLNNSGAWKTIVRFDASDEKKSDMAMGSAAALQAVDGSARFRITTRDSLPTTLMFLESGEWKSS